MSRDWVGPFLAALLTLVALAARPGDAGSLVVLAVATCFGWTAVARTMLASRRLAEPRRTGLLRRVCVAQVLTVLCFWAVLMVLGHLGSAAAVLAVTGGLAVVGWPWRWRLAQAAEDRKRGRDPDLVHQHLMAAGILFVLAIGSAIALGAVASTLLVALLVSSLADAWDERRRPLVLGDEGTGAAVGEETGAEGTGAEGTGVEGTGVEGRVVEGAGVEGVAGDAMAGEERSADRFAGLGAAATGTVGATTTSGPTARTTSERLSFSPRLAAPARSSRRTRRAAAGTDAPATGGSRRRAKGPRNTPPADDPATTAPTTAARTEPAASEPNPSAPAPRIPDVTSMLPLQRGERQSTGHDSHDAAVGPIRGAADDPTRGEANDRAVAAEQPTAAATTDDTTTLPTQRTEPDERSPGRRSKPGARRRAKQRGGSRRAEPRSGGRRAAGRG